MEVKICNHVKKLSQGDKKIVSEVLDKFKNRSALELEGITTLDYVACSLSTKGNVDDTKIINGVKRIKGTKFSDNQLHNYLNILKECGYLS